MNARALLADGFRTFAAKVLTVVATAAVAILVSRAIGPDGRGLYVLPGMLAFLGSMTFAGLKTVIPWAMLQEKRGKAAVHAALLSSLPLVAAGALAVVAMAAVLRQPWSAPYAIAALPFMAMAAIASGYGYGIKNVRIPNLVNLAASVVMFAFIGTGFWLQGRQASVAIAMWLLSNVVVGATCIIWVLIHVRSAPPETIALKPFLFYATRLSGLYIVRVLNYRVDLYIVAFLASLTALGLYGVAVSGAEALLAVTEVAAIVSLPEIGALGRSEAAALTARFIRANAVLAGGICVAAVIVAPYAVVALYGPAFAPAIPALQVLCVGIVALSVVSVLTNYYTVNAGRAGVPLAMQAFSTIICIGVSFWLVPIMGILGAAIATTASYVLSVGAVLAWFARETRIPLRQVVFLQRTDVIALKFACRSTGVARESSIG